MKAIGNDKVVDDYMSVSVLQQPEAYMSLYDDSFMFIGPRHADNSHGQRVIKVIIRWSRLFSKKCYDPFFSIGPDMVPAVSCLRIEDLVI